MSADAAVVKAKSLEERVTEKLHEQIGDLITPADLKDMVRTGVQKALFEKRKEATGSSYTPYREIPPLVDELVDKHLRIEMQTAVTDWIKENPKLIQEAVEKAIQRGVADALMTTMDERFKWIFSSAVETMRQQGILPR